MAAFDSAFDTAFDGAGGGAQPLATGTAAFAGQIAVVNPLVFDSSAGYVAWYPSVVIGGVDVSARLTGALQITAGEDAARVASFSVIPASAAQLSAFDSAIVTIDLTLFRTGQQATYRRFTGRVESVEFMPGTRTARIACRDGYQERPMACTTAAEVEALFAGLAKPCPAILAWNEATPSPDAYFYGLLATVPGAVCIDSGGAWRVVPWQLGAPLASFGAGEVFHDSVVLTRPSRADVPSAIEATLTHRYPRLHSALINLTWDAVTYDRHLIDGLQPPPKAMIVQAIEGLSGWLVKGDAGIQSPTPGNYPVITNGNTFYYGIPDDVAEIIAKRLDVTMVKRWYQEVDAVYRVTIDMGGLSERETAVAAAIQTEFDGSDWETAPSVKATTGLYQANGPTQPTPPTGYEGLRLPHPPGNGAIDYWGDITQAELDAAAEHVAAIALRRAASGKRKQTIAFGRPIDPRWEIGDVLAVAAVGVAGTGQVVAFEDSLDLDSADATSTLTLACPDGSGAQTAATATLTAPPVAVAHALLAPSLGNPVGAAVTTPAVPNEDTLLGFLCNVMPYSPNYDASKPVYNPQFRIILPEIPATDRDPITVDGTLAVTVNIAGSGVNVSF